MSTLPKKISSLLIPICFYDIMKYWMKWVIIALQTVGKSAKVVAACLESQTLILGKRDYEL
jgi:hypothetical protein